MSGYDHRVAGKRLSRLDGVGKVTGKHVYAADFVLPGMLGDVARIPLDQLPGGAYFARLELANQVMGVCNVALPR